MSIKLDWEVESEGGWDEVGEDPRDVELRKRRLRRIRNGLIVILAIMLVVGGVITYRLITVGQQVRAALEATIAAETLALRIGDREAYLAAQSDVGGWRQIQEQTFEHYQSETDRLEVTGQILEMDINADRARVILREVLNGVEYHVLWFYQRDASGWNHIAPDPSFWGERQERRSAYFDFDYYSEDQELVDDLVVQLNNWWGTACSLTRCVRNPDRPVVTIEPDRLARVGWADYDSNTLIVPSPLVGRYRADGEIDPALMSQLAGLIAQRWAENIIGDEGTAYSEIQWLESEVYLWLRQSFVPELPPSPLLTPLVQAYGEQIVRELVTRVQSGEDAVAALEALTGSSISDLSVGWELYFTYRLRAEAALIADNHKTEAVLLYRDPERPTGYSWRCMEEVQVDSIWVTGTQQYGDLLWAETQCSAKDGIETADFVPFRLLDSRWVHTVPTQTDWGPAKEERGTSIILRYFDIDTPHTDGLLAELEQIYSQVIKDFGMEDSAPYVGVLVTIFNPASGTSLISDRTRIEIEDWQRGVIELELVSPYSTEFPADISASYSLACLLIVEHIGCMSQDGFHYLAAASLIHELVQLAIGTPPSDAYLVAFALMAWERERLLDYPDESMGTFWVGGDGNERIPYQPPESLESLWEVPDDAASYNYTNSMLLVLFDLLVERYGEGAIAQLASNLSEAGSMDDWLNRSLGIHAVDIEAEWLERINTLP
ncbi:MAG: hypothetical protein JXB30_18770 [Anaerolineae bacterium]|nr:hypothetical protein [Anaerolineae bacterium]